MELVLIILLKNGLLFCFIEGFEMNEWTGKIFWQKTVFGVVLFFRFSFQPWKGQVLQKSNLLVVRIKFLGILIIEILLKGRDSENYGLAFSPIFYPDGLRSSQYWHVFLIVTYMTWNFNMLNIPYSIDQIYY